MRPQPNAVYRAAQLLRLWVKTPDAIELLNCIVAKKQSDPMLYTALRISLAKLLENDKVRNEIVSGWNLSDTCGPEVSSPNTDKMLVAINSAHADELFEVM